MTWDLKWMNLQEEDKILGEYGGGKLFERLEIGFSKSGDLKPQEIIEALIS